MVYNIHSVLPLTFSITFPLDDAFSTLGAVFSFFLLAIRYSWAMCRVYEMCAPEKEWTRCNNIEFMKKHLQWLQNTLDCLHLLCPETDTAKKERQLEKRTTNITTIQLLNGNDRSKEKKRQKANRMTAQRCNNWRSIVNTCSGIDANVVEIIFITTQNVSFLNGPMKNETINKWNTNCWSLNDLLSF